MPERPHFRVVSQRVMIMRRNRLVRCPIVCSGAVEALENADRFKTEED
jgi:hypothetical protein